MKYDTDNVFLIGIVIHYVAYFLCQTKYQIENRHQSFSIMLNKAGVYTTVWGAILFILFIPDNTIEVTIGMITPFMIVTLVIYLIIDSIVSKAVHYYFHEKMEYAAYLYIGLGQLLHLIQLFLTYKHYICSTPS